MMGMPETKIGNIIEAMRPNGPVSATVYFGPDFCEGWDGWEVDCKDSEGNYLYAKWVNGQWCVGMPY